MKDNVIYNAGSMFTEAQWNQRKMEGKKLREMFPSFEIHNPVDFDSNQVERPTNTFIFEQDYNGLTDSKFVIFEIDGWDSGTHMEFGLMVEQAINNPNKYLLPIVSDFRVKQGILEGEFPGFGINEMFSGAFHYEKLNKGDVPQMIVCESHEKAREAIKAICDNDTKNFRDRFDIKDIYKKNN
ncbi:nucleoside 2-deoxyribosyltransferase [Spiroplasma apis]|uniref:Nucleoside 2-deoxyribosyltransferase n=1 Tax=Spiroplasma apis B31 TaxID=1276258 RepID=V5RHB0_SPIAP|nr:nucleoside 2-deoxyribosyltransferase [Spiroplasma apis]AHB36042.1 hypothetical protein SAPIS_v1c01960 [Spiroplasma apis B31]